LKGRRKEGGGVPTLYVPYMNILGIDAVVVVMAVVVMVIMVVYIKREIYVHVPGGDAVMTRDDEICVRACTLGTTHICDHLYLPTYSYPL
jgi:hypothetical protein